VATVKAVGPVVLALAAAGWLVAPAPPADADALAYLVNVTVRPGYNFPNADAALAYGNGVCERIRAGVAFDRLVGEIKVDFAAVDDFQAIYLISQAAQELCPGTIGQLRISARGFQSAG